MCPSYIRILNLQFTDHVNYINLYTTYAIMHVHVLLNGIMDFLFYFFICIALEKKTCKNIYFGV